MGNYKTIRDEVIDIVAAAQLSGASAFAEVTGTIKEQFSGYPAASIIPSEVTSEYLTVAENTRQYGLSVNMHYGIASSDDWQTALDVMLDLSDVVMDALDSSIDLNATCDFLQAVPMTWEVMQTGQQMELVGTIKIVASKRVNVQ